MLFLLIIVACSDPVDDRDGDPLEPGRVQILYKGIVNDDGTSWAMFTLVNDSTEDLEYFAYNAAQPHYSTEMLSDTGWTWLMWNWCGTGASYHTLGSGEEVDFKTGLPHLDCTWRVILSATCDPETSGFIVRSRAIDFAITD